MNVPVFHQRGWKKHIYWWTVWKKIRWCKNRVRLSIKVCKNTINLPEPNTNQSTDGQTSTSTNSPVWMTTALMKWTWLPINPASERALSSHRLTALETLSVSNAPRQIGVKKWSLCNLVHCDRDRRETDENMSVFTWFPNRLKPFMASSAAFARPTELQGQETQRITQLAIRRFEWHCQSCKIGTISSNKYSCVMKALAGTTNVLKSKRKMKHSYNCT